MMRTRPKNVVRTGPVRLPRKGDVSLTDPRTQAPTFVRPAKSARRSTMYALSEARARRQSENMGVGRTAAAYKITAQMRPHMGTFHTPQGRVIGNRTPR